VSALLGAYENLSLRRQNDEFKTVLSLCLSSRMHCIRFSLFWNVQGRDSLWVPKRR